MSLTPSTEPEKGYLHYRSRRAKTGMSQLKSEYLEHFRFYNGCYMHSVIKCSGKQPPADWLERKQEFLDLREHYRAQLERVIK